MSKRIFHILLIIVVGFLVYSNTFNVPFHFDDRNNIVENYKLRDLSNSWPPSGSRWVGFLTFALNYYFGGLNTIGYHIANLVIHIFNAILIYWLVVLTLRVVKYQRVIVSEYQSSEVSDTMILGHSDTSLVALFSALLFVAHPIQTQAVTYIVQRFTSLAAMFYLLSLVMYIKFRNQSERPSAETRIGQSAISSQQKLPAARYTLYAVSLISAVLAMKTKEIAFTLPIIVALYEFMFFGNNQFVIPVKTGIQDKNEMDSCFRRNNRMEGGYKRLLYLIPFLLTLLVIPLSLIGIDKPIGDAIGEIREAAQETEAISRWGYLLTQFRVIVTYIRLLFLPINQNLDYDYPIYHSFSNPQVFLSFLFLLSICGLGVYLFYRSRHNLTATSFTNPPSPPFDKGGMGGFPDFRLISFGIFWFFITLSVESSIIPIRDVIFEHRLYLPIIGIIIVFVSATFYILQAMIQNPRRSLIACCSLLATAVIVLSIAAYQRNIVWQDEMSLWEDVVRKSPQKARGHNNLGIAYKDKGLTDKAIEHYQIALRINPDYVEAYNNLGAAYYNKGLTDMAIEHYQIALRINPNYAEAYNNLGAAYYNKSLTDKGIEHYQIALKLYPDYADAHYNLGVTYEIRGLLDKAIKEYQIALRLNPEDKITRNRILQIQRNK
ncbi:MAG: hypothetical protein FD156_254 [Nitrospirae bacterium]|nr:MAG: hypothetical protein FD156_254 [Nitrospirota bacterium]